MFNKDKVLGYSLLSLANVCLDLKLTSEDLKTLFDKKGVKFEEQLYSEFNTSEFVEKVESNYSSGPSESEIKKETKQKPVETAAPVAKEAPSIDFSSFF
jgi:hypothetical protein